MSIRINFSEIYRYMGYKGTTPDEDMRRRVELSAEKVLAAAQPRAVSEAAPLEFFGGDGLKLGELKVTSKSLRKNMAGCEQVIFFAATLGVGVDRVIARASQSGRVSEAFICQAAAAAIIEEYCDSVNGALRDEFSQKGLYLRPRFSPGYGDFSIEHQRDILAILRAQQRIGLTVTEAMLLAPMKSVTAVIGAGREKRGESI